MTPLIEARDVTIKAQGRLILDHVSLSVARGEIITIVGPNGSGKTTLLRAMIGALAPSAGRIARAADLRIGYAPQRMAIDRRFPLDVTRFLKLGGPSRAQERSEALARVGALKLAQTPMAALSGGERQRVLLARALLRKPDLLALDEPTQGLDQPGEAAFYLLLEEWRRETGGAVLMIGHDLHVVMGASDRVICLNGHICCEGAPNVVRESPEYRALFGLGSKGALALYRHEHDHHHHHHSEEGGC